MVNAISETDRLRSRSIVLDFDGTVTVTDLLDRAALEFGDPAVYEEVEHGLDGGRLPLREVITREFEPVTAPLDEVVAWALEEAQIRPGFARVRSRGAGRGLGCPRRLERLRGADPPAPPA